MSNVDLTYCASPGCHDYGVFPGADDDGRPIKLCFTHSAEVDALADEVGAALATAITSAADPTDDGTVVGAEPEWHEDVVAGLAAILLDHTAMTYDERPDAVEAAMLSLAQATNMPTDFAAGLLMATTWLAAAGELDAEVLSSGAEQFEAEANGGPIPFTVVDPSDVDEDDVDSKTIYRRDQIVIVEDWSDEHRDRDEERYNADVLRDEVETDCRYCGSVEHISEWHAKMLGPDVCAYCESDEHQTAEHLKLYPLPARTTGAQTESVGDNAEQE